MSDYYLGQGDTPTIAETLLDETGAPVDINAASITMTMTPIAGAAPVVDAAAMVNDQVGDGSDGSKGKVHRQMIAGETGTPGDYLMQIVATMSGKPQTFPNDGYLLVTITAQPATTGLSLSPRALITVEDALRWLRRSRATGYPAADDVALLTLAINGASEAIIRYTGREYLDPSGDNTDVARTFEYDGSGFLSLAPYDLRSITSLTLGGLAMTATTGAGDGDYVPMPRNQTREGTYLYLIPRGYFRLGPSHFLYSPVLKTRDVVITGKWGMTAIPPDIYMACLIAVDDLYRNPEQGAGRGSGEFQITEAPRTPGGGGLPEGVMELIEPFKRPQV